MSGFCLKRGIGLIVGAGFAGVLAGVSGVFADDVSAGPKGINALVTGLSGNGVGIGQLETGRPGDGFLDNAANSNTSVFPFRVYQQTGVAVANTNVADHAEEVAGVMISKDAVGSGGAAGVAPTAFLFSDAYVQGGGGVQPNTAASAQFEYQQAVALGHPIVAMNFSFGKPLEPGATLNGDSLLSEFVDWSAATQNILYVIAGNEDVGGKAVPTDSYDGMVVSYTTTDANGVFNTVDGGNNFTETPTNGRRTVDLTAPGDAIKMPAISAPYIVNSGTSFAAPQVTAGDALLVNYNNNQIAAGNNSFTFANQHQVEKAILMNSADKVQDTGNGLLLGMQKTILNTAGNNYFTSDAYNNANQNVPIDAQMGSGQLDVARAITQAAGGQAHSTGTVVAGPIGWDYSFTIAAKDSNKYVIGVPLLANSYISATLAWDRVVTLNDTNNNGQYDPGETFNDVGLTNLDLILMQDTGVPAPVQVWSSVSTVDSVQQIFFKIPTTAVYELDVTEIGAIAGGGATQTYGLAWWSVPVPEPTAMMLLASATIIGRLRRRPRFPRY